MYVYSKLLIFDLLPACSSLFILHAGYIWIFEWKIEEWKERREFFFFFCKLKIKDGNVFYTDIYSFLHIYISIYIFIYKKSLRLFNKTFSNYQATFSEHRERLDPSPPRVCFHLLFKYPLPPSTTNHLLKRVRWKRWKELMIRLVHSCI